MTATGDLAIGHHSVHRGGREPELMVTEEDNDDDDDDYDDGKGHQGRHYPQVAGSIRR